MITKKKPDYFYSTNRNRIVLVNKLRKALDSYVSPVAKEEVDSVVNSVVHGQTSLVGE